MKKNKLVLLSLLLLKVSTIGASGYPSSEPFQSTSSSLYGNTDYQQSSLTPMLDNNGAAVYPYAGSSARRNTNELSCVFHHYDDNYDGVCDVCEEACERGEGANAGTGGDPSEPIGSAVPALLLLAGGYAAVVAYSKRKVE